MLTCQFYTWTFGLGFSLVTLPYFALSLSSIDTHLDLTCLNYPIQTIFGKSFNLPSLDLVSTSWNLISVTGHPQCIHICRELIINRSELNGLIFSVLPFIHSTFIEHLLYAGDNAEHQGCRNKQRQVCFLLHWNSQPSGGETCYTNNHTNKHMIKTVVSIMKENNNKSIGPVYRRLNFH